MNTNSEYAAADGGEIYQEYAELVASDTFGTMRRRRSSDNGKSWSASQEYFVPKTTEAGVERQGESALLSLPDKGLILRFFNMHLYPGGTHTKEVMALTKICWHVSRDQGRTFDEPRQIIVEGCTAEEWAPQTKYGANSIMVSFSAPFIDRLGRIILPAHWLPTLDQAHPDSYRVLPMEALCLIGRPQDDLTITWTISPRIAVARELSSRGLCEPTIAELRDGRFLCVMRGSNIFLSGVPGRKWVSLSEDGAATWSRPRPLGYEDGELIFSPATGSRLLRHSRSGQLYWIGNIVNDLTNGNAPRHPLSIARFDEDNICLARDSVTIIDQKGEGDTERLQLSNFRVYEDRETGEFVLSMARIFETSATEMKTPLYEYRIGRLD
jgi:hypothetical protein